MAAPVSCPDALVDYRIAGAGALALTTPACGSDSTADNDSTGGESAAKALVVSVH